MPFVKIFRGRQRRTRRSRRSSAPTCACPSAPWATCARRSPRSAPASAASCSCSNATATRRSKTVSALVYEQSEKLARAAVRQIPDGVYEAESFMDDDGVNLGKHIPIKVRVEVHGDEMTIDLSDVSPQVAGYLQLRRHRGTFRRRSCFQMHHDAAAAADQRRLVPPAEDHTAAGPRGERHQAGAGARVDDRADDRVRHDLSSAGSGLSRPHHRRPSRRPLHR